MCGRYGLFTPPDDLESRFDATVVTEFDPTYNAAPGESLPIVASDAPRTIRTAEWGLIPAWADDPDAHGHVNARAESLFDRASFRASAERRRCLVPADGFYEWGAPDGEHRPFFFRRDDAEPFAMAGLWERWDPPSTQAELEAFGADSTVTESGTIETFTIITTAANATVAPIHDRMPVVLPPDREREWLSAERERLDQLLEPAPPEALCVDPVSRAVNDPTNDGPELLAPIDR